MSQEDTTTIDAIMPNYGATLFKMIQDVWKISLLNQPTLYYNAVSELFVHLPNEVKTIIAPLFAQAETEIRTEIAKTGGVDRYQTIKTRQKRLQQMQHYSARSLLNRIYFELDTRGYLERTGGRVVPTSERSGGTPHPSSAPIAPRLSTELI